MFIKENARTQRQWMQRWLIVAWMCGPCATLGFKSHLGVWLQRQLQHCQLYQTEHRRHKSCFLQFLHWCQCSGFQAQEQSALIKSACLGGSPAFLCICVSVSTCVCVCVSGVVEQKVVYVAQSVLSQSKLGISCDCWCWWRQRALEGAKPRPPGLLPCSNSL